MPLLRPLVLACAALSIGAASAAVPVLPSHAHADNPHPRPTSCREYGAQAQQAFEQELVKQHQATR